MKKRRMIHKDFFDSENVSEWTLRQRLLVIGIIALADDQGRVRGHPRLLCSQIFPYDDFSASEIDEDLNAIAEKNDTVMVYRVNGKRYIQLKNWWEYQSHQWAKPSDFPAPERWTDRIRMMVYKPERWVMSLNWPGVEDRKNYQVIELGNETDNSITRSTGIVNININTNIDSILKEWETLFPDKPKIRSNNKSIPKKIKARLGNKDFVENWKEAMKQASKSPTLNEKSWFNLEFFVRNDINYQKCLDGWMDWKDEEITGKPPPKFKHEDVAEERKRNAQAIVAKYGRKAKQNAADK